MTCEACAMVADKYGLHGDPHEELKKLILKSPYYTGLFICGLDWFGRGTFHRNLDTWFRTGLARNYRRFLVMTPRGHLKTSYFGIAYMVNLILNDPEIRILYRMSSAANAEKTLAAVTEIFLGSEGMRHWFPDRILSTSDRNTTINAKMIKVKRHGTYREGTIEARSHDYH